MFELKYIELKSGYTDNGPAWIGKVKTSKSGQTVYFNNKGFRKYNGTSGNYYDIETGDEYWITGVKKDETNRHWAGNGKIIIAKSIVDEYLNIIGKEDLNSKIYIVEDISDIDPIERINKFENSTR